MYSRRLREKVDERLFHYRAAKEQVRSERRSLRSLEARLEALEEAQGIAQRVAQRIQSQAHKRIAEIVTKALAIFEEPYEFRIEFERKRGRTEARLVFVKDGHEVDPISASGLGVVDVASFALRLACLVLSRPQRRRLLVIDEPFRQVSTEYRSAVRALLRSLAEDLGIQLLMVTHDRALCSGTVLRLPLR